MQTAASSGRKGRTTPRLTSRSRAVHIFATYHPNNQPFAFGLGVYAPFGLKTEWPDDASFRSAGLYGSLDFIDFNPTFAVQITRSLSAARDIRGLSGRDLCARD